MQSNARAGRPIGAPLDGVSFASALQYWEGSMSGVPVALRIEKALHLNKRIGELVKQVLTIELAARQL